MQSFTEQITFLYTRDLEASARFYEQDLGLDLVLDQGTCRIYRIGGGSAYLGVCQRDDAPQESGDPGTRHVIVTFVTDDVDEWYERLVRGSGTADQPPAENPSYGIYHAFVRDPNGYRIEIQRFLDPRWREARPGTLES